MKIVQLLPELNEGGVERGTVELSRELVKQGIESVVISAGGTLANQIEKDGGQHILLDVCSKNILTVPSRIAKLRQVLTLLKPDILHARSRVPAWLSYLVNKTLHLPLVTTVHGFNSVNPYSKVMTYGDRVICVSGAIKEYIQENYQIPDEKITVIPRGVDLNLFHPDHIDESFIHQFRQTYHLEGKFIATSVGRITQLKDYETFIRGVVLAKQQIPNICGVIVGGVRQDKQHYFESLQTLVSDLDATDDIRFTGSQKQIAEIYALSDLVAICSRKPESFGRTAAEALAMNVPVIATNHGGVLDIVKNGENGALFEKGDYKELAERITTTHKISFLNLRSVVVKEFNLEAMVANIKTVYSSVLGEE